MMGGLVWWLRPYAEYLTSVIRGLRVTSTYRSYTQQLELYRNRANNQYPVAPPGYSWHEYGRAFDMVGRPEVLQEAGALWRQMGGSWWDSDPIHFQA